MKERIINDIFKHGLIGCFDCYGNRIKMNKSASSFVEDIPEFLLVIVPKALNYNFMEASNAYDSLYDTLDIRHNFYKDWLPAVCYHSYFVPIDKLTLIIRRDAAFPTISEYEDLINLANSGHRLTYFIFRRVCFNKTYDSASLTYTQLGEFNEKCPEKIQDWYRTLIGLSEHIDYTKITRQYKSSEDHIADSLCIKRKKYYQTLPEIEKVIFNDPATIVFWEDGTKTIVKNDDRYKTGKLKPYDPEKGLSMAISKKALGNDGKYYNEFRKWLPKEN